MRRPPGSGSGLFRGGGEKARPGPRGAPPPGGGVPPEPPREENGGNRIPPLHGALLKNEQDVSLFEKLAFLTRRDGRKG